LRRKNALHVIIGSPNVSTKAKFGTTGMKTKTNSSQGEWRVFDNFLLLGGKTFFSKSIFMNFIRNSLLHNMQKNLEAQESPTCNQAKLKLCFTIDIAIHVSAFLKIQFSSFELPN
jgi:hypothetical protein